MELLMSQRKMHAKENNSKQKRKILLQPFHLTVRMKYDSLLPQCLYMTLLISESVYHKGQTG